MLTSGGGVGGDGISYSPSESPSDGGEGGAAPTLQHPLLALSRENGLCAMLSSIVVSAESGGDTAAIASSEAKLTSAQRGSLRRVFAEHCAQYSLWRGSAPLLVRARRRIARCTGAAPALRSLLELDPARRPTMRTLMLSPLFASLRAPAAQVETEASSAAGAYEYFDAFAADSIDALQDV